MAKSGNLLKFDSGIITYITHPFPYYFPRRPIYPACWKTVPSINSTFTTPFHYDVDCVCLYTLSAASR